MHCRMNLGVDRKEVLRKRHVVLLDSACRSGDRFAETTVRPAACRRARTVPGMRAWWYRLAASDSLHLLSAGCHSIDKQAASGDYSIAGRKTVDHLDRVAIGKPDLDPPQLDRLFIIFVAHHPDAGGFALVNDGVARDRDRVVTFAGEELHAREHFRLEQPGGVVDRRAHQEPPDGWIERRRHVGNI